MDRIASFSQKELRSTVQEAIDCESLEVTVAWSSSSSSLFFFESQGVRLDSLLCSALVACWRSWLPSLPGARRDFRCQRQDCSSPVVVWFPRGVNMRQRLFFFFFMDQQRTLGRVKSITKDKGVQSQNSNRQCEC
eukprot:g22051.t1